MKMSKGKLKSKTEKFVNEEAELLKSQLVRTLADYDNLVKRVEREKGEIQKMVSLRLILKLLTALDMFESAQKHLQDSGLAIGIMEFKKVLSEEGLTEINPKAGDIFDENTMEAIEVVNGARDNTIIGVMLPGWKYEDGTVARHAKVNVSKRSS
jgi:molecular chaperone GrpE